MSVASNPNRRQALREATEAAIAQFKLTGGYVTQVAPQRVSVKSFRHTNAIVAPKSRRRLAVAL